MTDPQPPGPRHIPRPVPVHPVLFAIYPALFLYAQNVGEVAARDVIGPLLVLAAGALVALVLLSLPFRDARRAAIVVSAVAIAATSYGFVDRVLPRQIPGVAQQVGWVLVILVAIVVAIRIRRWLGTVTTALNSISAILVVLTLVTIVPFLLGTIGSTPATTSSSPTGGAATPVAATGGRDIYYIILDRYGSARSLSEEYGITDNDFYGWLADRGFTVAADSHANYVKTPLSIASTLRMDFLDDIVARMGKDSGDHQPIFDIFQDHPVGRFLKSRGYRYVHIGSTYQPTKVSGLADENLHAGTVSDFDTALYDLSALPAIGRRLGWLSSDPKRERQRSYALYEFDALERVRSEPGPKFVFAHILMPHPPYVFTADGTYAPKTTIANGPATYATQLAYTNTRMKAIIEPLLALPEAERPIIIVQGDEGPFPKRYNVDTTNFDWSTATTEELEMKYGILNAMYLPGLPPGKQLPYPTISSVNTFRLLFDDYFEQDLPLLPDRSFTSRAKFRPYDLTEITDKLPSLAH